MKFKQLLIWGVLSFIISFLISKIWFDPTMQGFFNANYWRSLFRFGETLRITNTQYVDENKSQYQALTDNAISGMITKLDRHSSYYKPDEYSSFKDDTHRRYVGIGVMIRKVEDGVLITRVFENGPAEESGLSMGDYIVKVEGIDIGSWDLPEVSTKIKGEEGTSVNITIRSRNNKLNDLLVSRRKITISSVEGVVVDQNHTGYLRLVQFTSRSGKECSDAIAELLEMGMKSLVLDLRDNSGGLLSAAVEIADLFLPRDQLIVTIKGRDENEVRNYRCHSVPVLPDLPVAVLMNEGSASASEIVGGALSVSGRAKVVGEQSFGKGSVQTIFPTENQSGLRLTTAMYFLPDGSTIHEQGVTPDVLVKCSDENETKLRIQRYSLDIMNSEEFKSQFDFAPIADVQLLEAKKLLLIESDKKNVKNI